MNNNYIEQKKSTHVYFKIGENKYAVDSANVLEIMKLPALDYPQKLPNNIVGLFKYNNFVINIMDIRFYLNIEVTPYTTNNELLIVRTDEVIYGIIVDKVIGITSLDPSNIEQIPYGDYKMIVESLYKMNDETLFIINTYVIERYLRQQDSTTTNIDILSLFPSDNASKDLMKKRTESLKNRFSNRLISQELQVNDKYLSLNLGNDYYCIPLSYVKEVSKDVNITPIPGTPDFIAGILNVRGDYITVIDLKRFLNLADTKSVNKNSVIIVNTNEFMLAFLIDQINELFDYQEMSIGLNSDSYYLSEFVCNDTLYTLLNMEKILSDEKLIITES